MIVPRLNVRIRVALAALAFTALLAFSLLQRRPYTRRLPIFGSSNDNGGFSSDLDAHVDLWRKFEPLLMTHEPKCDSPTRLGKVDAVGFSAIDPQPRPDLLQMPVHDILKMKKAHQDFVAAIDTDAPTLHYIPGTRGLVTTAGGSYLPVMVISLRMLRRTGSQLPVEVFLADRDEYEEYICEEVLPSLSAKCVILSTVLSAVPDARKIEHYQFKPFAILFSSFEELLFLDADAFPIHRPELLFEHEPYVSTHMVTWPDFWASSASPIYFAIAGQEIPPMNLRQSTESGEVLISKKTHSKTLLLCTYYNYWGPTHYYSLFSQGAAGEGDKETFVAAAIVMRDPFYQVSEPINALGHPSAKAFAGSAMAQFDPIEDFALTSKGQWRINGSSSSDAPAPRPFFIHANFPKFNPATVFGDNFVNPAFNDDGTYTRAWLLPEETVKAFGRDVEKQFWSEILWTGCELEDKFRSWKYEKGVCENVQRYWDAMFGPEVPENV